MNTAIMIPATAQVTMRIGQSYLGWLIPKVWNNDQKPWLICSARRIMPVRYIRVKSGLLSTWVTIFGNGKFLGFFNEVKVGKMDEDKYKDGCAGVGHGLGSPGASACGGFHLVLSTPGFPVLQKENDPGDDMEEEDRVETGFKNWNKNSERVEMVGVGIERIPPPENCTVADGVDEEKTAQHQPSKSHDVLFA